MVNKVNAKYRFFSSKFGKHGKQGKRGKRGKRGKQGKRGKRGKRGKCGKRCKPGKPEMKIVRFRRKTLLKIRGKKELLGIKPLPP